MKFTLRDLFWLVLVAAIGCAWWLDRARSARREKIIYWNSGDVLLIEARLCKWGSPSDRSTVNYYDLFKASESTTQAYVESMVSALTDEGYSMSWDHGEVSLTKQSDD